MTRLGGRWWSGPVVLAVLLTVVGGASVWRATPNGLVLGNDSVTYWSAASAIGEGRGVTTPFENEYAGLAMQTKLDRAGAYPVTLWPPLTPVSLWVADRLLPGSLESAARVLQVVLAGLSAGATGLLAWRLTNGGRGGLAAGAAAGIALAVNPAFVTAHVLLASEPLYLLFSTVAIVGIGRAVLRPRAATLGGAVAFTAAASLTRIVGVSLATTMGVAFVAFGTGERRRRALIGFATSLGAIVPLLLWQLTTIDTPARGVAWHGRNDLAGEALRAGRDLVLAPASPRGSTPALVMVAAFVAAVIAAWGWWTARHQRPAAVQAGVAAIALVTTAAMLLVTVLVVDRTFPLDARTTLPLLPALLALVSSGGVWATRWVRSHLAGPTGALTSPPAATGHARPDARVGIAVVGLAALASAVVVLVQVDRSAHTLWGADRAGLATPTERTADADAVAALDDDLMVFANQPAAVYVPSGRGSAAVPTATYPMTGRTNPDAAAELDELAAMVRAGRAVVVIDKPSRFFTSFLVDADALADRDGIDVVYDGERITILGATDRP